VIGISGGTSSLGGSRGRRSRKFCSAPDRLTTLRTALSISTFRESLRRCFARARFFSVRFAAATRTSFSCVRRPTGP
jgi:hypothetical protein